MKQYLLVIIAVLAAIILALFSIETEQGHSHMQGAYRYVNQSITGVSSVEDMQGSVVNPQFIVSEETEMPDTENIAILTAHNEIPTPIEARNLAFLHQSAMMELSPVQLPPLDAGMVNVTGGFEGDAQTAGYRVNSYPKDFAIAVPYDPSLLPQGFTEDDIQTYVYDRQYHRWVAIERDSVNEEEMLVCSRFRLWEKGLPHKQNDMADPQDALAQVQDMMSFASQGEGGGDSPLDFINAVLKTPEMPETSAYTPTSIKELKAADPLEGLTLMQPPTANNSGTANLSYPIEIPAGRQGMQPNLALTYSSSGGNGWLGVGWDISIPSITVETRWGVPRYDQSKESEVYVYEGEQLVTKDGNGNFRAMPHRTNQWTNRHDLDQDGYEQFFPRRNEAFDSIVRHGDGPSNYWWSVTHKNGVTDYYGKYASDNGVNNNCVLRVRADNTSGAIGHWALAESVDPFGNSVRYYYSVVSEIVGKNDDGSAIGKQIYVDSIAYTNKSTEQGKYKVIFNRRDRRRQDVSISANRGFLELTAATLCNIGVFYGDTAIREYMFFDTIGRFSNYKTRLTDVVRVDKINTKPLECVYDMRVLADENATRTHFDYFDSPQGNAIFGDEKIPDLYNNNDSIRSFFLSNPANLGDRGSSTALGSTRGKSWSVGGTASVGLGSNVALTSLSVGGNFNYSRSKSEGALTLIDLDGDGLADKVFKIGKKLFYRPQIAIDDSTFDFGDTLCIRGVSNFLEDASSTISWGLQASAFLAYNGSWPTTRSTTTTYFSDVNADGLPDLITEDGVLFNVTEPGGRVRFSSFYTMLAQNQNAGNGADSNVVHTSVDTCQGIIFDGEANDSIICYINWIRDTAFNAKEYNNQMPQQVLDYVDSLESTGEYYCEYRYSAHPTRVTEIYVYRKEMDCRPIFSQTSNSAIVTIPDPDMESVKVWVPDREGTVTIRSCFRLLNDSVGGLAQSKWRDGVSYAVQVCRYVSADNDYVLHATSYDTLFTNYVDKDDTTTKDTTFSIYLNSRDIVLFRLISGENHDFDKVSWQQTIIYPSHNIMDNYGVDKDYYDSRRDFLVSGRNFFAAPLNESGTYVRVSADIHTTTPYLSNTLRGYHLKVELHRNGADNVSKSWDIRNNMNHEHVLLKKNVIGTDSVYLQVQQEDYVTFTLEKKQATPNSQKFDWSEVQIVPHVEYLRVQGGDTVMIQEYYPPVKMEIKNYKETKTDSVFHALFGPLYRGWGQFAYNNNDTAAGAAVHDTYIHVDKLVSDLDMYPHDQGHADNGSAKIENFWNNIGHDSIHPQESSSMVSCYENAEMYNPIAKTTSWIEMQPDCKNRAWVGYGNVNYLTDSVMSNTRLPEYSADTNTVGIEEYDHPVPIVANHEVKTVRKQNISRIKNHSFSLSAVPVISMGMTCSSGENIILTDYMDLNGDRYPDIVGQSLVQYSNPWGGIGNPVPMGPFADGITKSKTNSGGENFGGSFQMPTRGVSNNPKGSKISFDGSGNIGADLGGGTDETVFSWVDINGDGLPDRVFEDDFGYKMVCLNIGYAFEARSSWGEIPVRDGKSENAGLNFGANFNFGQASIGGGMGVNVSQNHTCQMLTDFNGDGLPDLVKKGGSGLAVRYNIGNGNWSEWENISKVSDISFGRSYSESVNASATLGFTLFGALKICVGISGSPHNRTFSRDSVQLTDINGDGYPDYVTSENETNMTVRYNRSGKTNLLRKVTNFTGSTVEMDYDMPLSSFEKPQRSWNLAEVRVRNNDSLCPVGGNRTLTHFEYSDPNYNRVERMDYGYRSVITYQHDTENNDEPYRLTVEEFNNREFAKRGRKTRDCVYDGNWTPFIEHLYDAIVYDFADSIVSDDGCSRSDVYVGVESDLTNWYEGNFTAQVTSRMVRKYDRYRNVTEYIHYGDTTHNREYFKAVIDYAKGMPHNLVSLPVRITVKDADSALVQQRTAAYSDSGKVRQIAVYFTLTDSSVYSYTYDPFGNPDTCRLPENLNGQRLMFAYRYDNIIHSYSVRVDNVSLGFFTTASYDFKFGKPTSTVDINGNEMRYLYDFMGRNTVILAPYEIGTNHTYTIKMEYHPKNYGNLDIPDTGRQSYACTYHYDRQHEYNPIRTTIITDGLGRLLQTKKDAEINGQEVSLVTGRVVYDCFGRTVKQYHPFTEDTAMFATYNDSLTAGSETETRYDILDRQTYVRMPMNLVTTMAYGFDTCYGRQCLRTTVIDPKGNKVKTLTGTLGQQLKQIAPGNTVTWFKYDCLGRLLQSTDPDNISTFYTYDMAGRMVQRIHPDADTDRYHYDAAGNLTFHVNSLADSIFYSYHYNQLTDIQFPRYPANNVHYQYGTLSDANINAVGKVILQEDASGWQNFSYGKLGELTENIRTFALPYESQTNTFRMQYEYDSWNRIQNIIYPDGEWVRYGYNQGGVLNRITGQKNSQSYHYIDSILYNKFELKEAVWYGNGTRVLYEYDTLQRLSRLRSYEGNNSLMQDITYDYDSVSNITGIVNSAAMLPNGLGGTYNNSYTYDNLYRLTGSSGNWHGGSNLSYQTVTQYHANGRVGRKNLAARTLLNGITDTVNYARDYSYAEAQPNTLVQVSSESWNAGGLIVTAPEELTFAWDATGNMVTQHLPGGDRRLFCWDEQNRLQGVKDNGHLSYYQYDANGDRTYKLTGKGDLQNISGSWQCYYLLDDATLYASPYLVATGKGYTKHYYAESERIASRIGGGGLHELDHPIVGNEKIDEKKEHINDQADDMIGNCLDAKWYNVSTSISDLYIWRDSVQPEKECYWYHPDHLGSSSWITYSNGKAVQHLHYLPWGEDFVDQRTNSFDGVRYTFSAKERDSETGLSYFGSRYYSSDLSIWLSVDPMSDKYAYQSGYVYCGNNPIKVIDPNGEDEWEVNEAGYIRCIHNDKPDRLYAVYGSGEEDWGERRLDVKPLDVDESIMKTMGNPGKSTTFSAQNKREKMNELFNFFADNTDVEWTQLCTHDNYGNEYDFIVTSHDNVGTELPSIYTVVIFNNAQDGLFDIFKHSHPKHYTGDNYYHKSIYPYTSHIASGGDMKTKAKIEQANGFVRRQPMFILRNGGLNYEY